MFWKFGFHSPSAVEAILDRESFTLYDLLDEEEIIQEAKGHNKKLGDFLSKKEVVAQLFELITVPAPDENDAKRALKYPFLACEVLCCEIWSVCETIVTNEHLLNQLFTLLETKSELDSRLATYFTRTVVTLLAKRLTEMLAYIQKRPELLERIIFHIAQPSIMELLLKLVACEEDTDEAFVTFLIDAKLVPLLVSRLDPSLSYLVHENAGQALVDIIGSTSMREQHPIFEQLCSDAIVKQLLEHTLAPTASSQTQGINVLIELLSHRVADAQQHEQAEVSKLPPLCKNVYDRIPDFFRLLTVAPNFTVTTQVGKVSPVFGSQRLKALEFFVAVVRSQYAAFDEKLISLNFIGACMDLFFDCKWNNFLHNLVVLLVTTVLEGTSNHLLMSMFTSSKLADRLLDAYKLLEKDTAEFGNVSQRAYMGHVLRMINEIDKTAEEHEKLEEFLKNHEGWKAFVSTQLQDLNAIENAPLGGARPHMGGDDSDDDDLFDRTSFLNDVSTLQNVFAADIAQNGPDDDDDDDDDEPGAAAGDAAVAAATEDEAAPDSPADPPAADA